jgi:hypothetical protein
MAIIVYFVEVHTCSTKLRESGHLRSLTLHADSDVYYIMWRERTKEKEKKQSSERERQDVAPESATPLP